MRCLHLFDGRRRDTRRLQAEFMLRLKEHCDFFIYGKDEQELNGEEISPIEFNHKLSLKDVANIIKPDIIVMPEYIISKIMLSRVAGFEQIKNIPKVSLEIDYYTYLNDNNENWYKEKGIDLIICRGPYAANLFPIRNVYLPWSAHEDFLTDPTTDYLSSKYNKILYVGGGRYSTNVLYRTRQLAIRMLELDGSLDYYGNVGYEAYPKLIKQYRCGLSCSLYYLNMAPAKAFEIMATGATLLSNDFICSDSLFPGKQCYFKYEQDCSDILKVSRIIQNDADLVKEVTFNAINMINNYHTDSIRAKELYQILESFVYGKPIEDKWDRK